MKTLGDWQRELYEIAKEKGWHDRPRHISEIVALLHSEASEILEEARDGRTELSYDENGKPVGVPSELADLVIRALDAAEELGIDLERVIEIKAAYNRTRPIRHGKAF